MLAAMLCAALLFSNLSPALALAAEPDSEGEGAAPPGAVEGAPHPEAGGEETVLEEVPGSLPSGSAEDTGEGPPTEAEPKQEPPLPPPPVASATTGAPPEAAPTVRPPQPAQGPALEAAPAPPASTPVEGQPLSAPKAPPSEKQTPHPSTTAQRAPAPPTPTAPPEEPEPAQAQPPATPAERSGGAGLAGRRFHIVVPGESLWSIAEALLPAAAGNAQIAAEVQRLWKLNASRIGTGDPGVLPVGVKLRLR
ncbi:MAG TPA: LysM domain-containing protein [Solirubrobacterales bacterium]|nr:LysM domain-containing protein [Solirubrobacterales bacterium]